MFALSHLQSFVAVAEELNFSRAAARLNMTQPPLSRQVQILEHLLGVRLLERTSRSVSLTPAGRVFLIEARRILGLAEGAARTAQRVARGEAGSLTIGFTAATSYTLLPRIVGCCRDLLPGVDLVLKEMVTTDQLRSLASNQIDLGFLRPPVDHLDFATLRVLHEPLLAAFPAGHPKAAREDVTVEDFHDEPMISFSPYEARYFYDLITSIFIRAGVTPRYVQYLSQLHAILAMVRDGLGAAIIPHSARTLAFEGVAFRPLQMRINVMAEMLLTWRHANTNPVLPGFLGVIREAIILPGAGQETN